MPESTNLDDLSSKPEEIIKFREVGGPQSVRTISEKREKTAGRLAFALLIVFAAILLSPLIYWLKCGSSPPSEMIEYAKDGAAMVVGLLGAVVAFYYSQKRLS